MLKYFIQILLIVITTFACAGSRGSIKFDNLKHPASMSAFLEDKEGKLLAKDYELKVVKEFSHTDRHWGIFFSLIPLSGTDVFIYEINKSVEEENAYGLINLSLTADTCAINDMPILDFFPLWPGCTNLTLKGEIVKIER